MATKSTKKQKLMVGEALEEFHPELYSVIAMLIENDIKPSHQAVTDLMLTIKKHGGRDKGEEVKRSLTLVRKSCGKHVIVKNRRAQAAVANIKGGMAT